MDQAEHELNPPCAILSAKGPLVFAFPQEATGAWISAHPAIAALIAAGWVLEPHRDDRGYLWLVKPPGSPEYAPW
jgi:hypothetical protein